MKRRKLIATALITVTIIIACSSAVNKKSATQDLVQNNIEAQPSAAGIPAFAMQDLNGDSINLQSLKGKKVFVNIWASWCPPCRAEMPSIEKLYAAVDRNKVAFVMLSYDENRNAALRFRRSNKLSLPVYFPTEQPPAVFKTDGIPATFIFNERGELIKQNFGAEDYNTDAYRQLLE